MADKGKKRKAFDIPALSELEEVIEVTPVFNRLKKTQKQVTVPKFCTKSTNSEVSKTKPLRAAEQISNEEYATPDIDISSGLKSIDCEETVEQNKFSKKEERDAVFVGKNFRETFAFIEKTKYYQPQPSKVHSDISETVISTSVSNAGQDTAIKSAKPNAIIVNQRQKGNPVLKFFRNVAWEYGDVVPDYVMGPRMCALFLSIRYHNFNPNYIHERLKQLGSCYELRVLLVQVDIKDPHKSLKELTKMAILADCTLILAWSAEEAARYLEMYKIYENKPPEVLQGQINTDYLSKLTDCLTTVKSVNKTDTVTLLSTFESLENIISASKDDIALCPGFGPQKAKRLHDAFHQPFIASKKAGEQDPSASGNIK